VFAIGLIIGEGYAQSLYEPGTAKVRFEDVRSKVLDTIERTGVASIAVAVAKDGEVVWEEGFGWANREQETKATPHTVYHIASISKSMTATGLMLLVERGLVDLDQPVNNYLGQSKLAALVGEADDATVSRVVFHTAGLPMHWNLFTTDGAGERPSMDESIRRYGILVTAPGDRYNYSNFGYGIIDYVISRVSGTEYAVFMRDEVFEPLGMARTSVQVDPVSIGNVAEMYDESQKAIAPYDFDHRGASAVLSSVHDLVRFGMFHLGNRPADQEPILSEQTLEKMHGEVGSRFEDGSGSVDYLLGSFAGVDYGGYRLMVTTGSMPGAAARLAMVPSDNVVTALVCNGDIDLWPIEDTILKTVLEDFGAEATTDTEAAPDDSGVSSVPPTSFVGSWSGQVVTYAGNIPVEMTFSDAGQGSLKMAGKPVEPIGIRTPLGEMGFKEDVFKGLFLGGIDTPDANRFAHVVFVECGLRDDRLVGTASAVAMNEYFCLPYRLELTRVEQ
jgi:CubicO group peptidase (beta-lactamase class C family)